MTWFKVDDGFAFHPKAIAAGNAALGLWVRAGSWCGGNLTDGFVPAHLIGTLGAQARDARALVEAGLWMVVDHTEPTQDAHQPHTGRTQNAHEDSSVAQPRQRSRVGPTGYQFVDWDHWQPTKAQVKAEREATRERVKRWRDQHRNGVTNGVSNSVGNGVSTPAPSRPVPSRSGLGSQSLPAVDADRQNDGLDLTRIKTALRSDDRRARLVAEQVLAKAPRPPGNPTAYVVNAISREPHLYRETSGPPALGALCPEHGRDRATCPPSWHEESA